jgi:hypothetical protein
MVIRSLTKKAGAIPKGRSTLRPYNSLPFVRFAVKSFLFLIAFLPHQKPGA